MPLRVDGMEVFKPIFPVQLVSLKIKNIASTDLFAIERMKYIFAQANISHGLR